VSKASLHALVVCDVLNGVHYVAEAMHVCAGSEFLGVRINVRHAAKKPPGQQSMPPRGKGLTKIA